MKLEHEHAIRALRTEQDRIRNLVRGVDERIDRLAQEFAKAPETDAEPVRIAPILKPRPEGRRAVEPPESKNEISPDPAMESPIDRVVLPSESVKALREVEPAPSKLEEAIEEPESFELTFGRVWLVRIGIVILLTGLVFLGNLAYQHIVPRLGPGAKLSLIVLAGAALGGVGAWLERAREAMRNYARVLIAGGCATIYYATYAAHFVQPLKVIESPLIGGGLLLALAGGIGWVAHRRRSETLAVLAVLLSYYTSGLNPVGGFTLFSSLLLTATAIFFLLKHRWVKLTFVSLVGTYASYAWARQFLVHVPPAESALAMQMVFLGGYWLLFTVGGFFSRRESMPAGLRTPFLTLNNGAFFALSTLETLRVVPSAFWMISLGFGAALLGLSWLARWKDPEDRTFDSAYLVQGLTLTTLGFASKLTGYQFALTLAAQSIVLLVGAGRHRVLSVVASILSVGGGTWCALFGLAFGSPHSELTAGLVVFVLGFDGWFFKRRFTANDHARIEPIAMALALAAVGLAIAWAHVAIERPEPWLAVGSIVCALLPLVFRFRELSLAGQVFYPAATAMWIWTCVMQGIGSTTIPVALIAIGVGLAAWWSWQRKFSLEEWLRVAIECVTAFCAAAVAGVWMVRELDTQTLLLTASLVGPVWIATGFCLRARMLSVAGLSFSLITLTIFALYQHVLPWSVGLAPIGHFLTVAGLARFADRFGQKAVMFAYDIRRVAIVIAGGMMLLWIFKNIPREWQALFFAVTGAACSLGGAARQVRELSITGVVLGGVAWILAVFYFQTAPTWQHLAAVIVFPAACRVARKLFPGDPTHAFTPQLTWAAMVGISLWMLRWADLHQREMSLTIIWTLLALGFSATGLLLRDRHYRLGGLVLLGLSVGRVFFIDVWAFNQVYRILSFIVLGVALLVVGYFYNRFEEKLRRWL